jgi:hypothetical protein
MTANGSLPQPDCPSSTGGGCTAQTVTVTVTALPGPSSTASQTSNLTTATISPTTSIVPFTGIGTMISPTIGINLLLGLLGFLAFQF